MAAYTASDWAAQVLGDVGAPVTTNNVNNILHWMVAEEPGTDWFDRNNPLNASLGTSASDGTGSYASLTQAAQQTAAMIRQSNMAPINQVLMQDGSLDSFSAAVVESPWASSHYGGNPNHIAQTSAQEGSIAAPDSAGSYTAGSASAGGGLTAAEYAALGPLAGNPADVAYLEGLAGGAGAAPGVAPAGTATPTTTPTTASTTIGGTPYNFTGANASSEASALSTISANLSAYGFSGSQLQQLTQWAWGEISSGVDPSQVPIDLQNPNTLGGQIFAQQFPYFHSVNQSLESQGQAPLDPATYMTLTQGYDQSAQAAGLPEGMVTGQGIATLMTGNVSPSEFSTRLNTALTLAYQATPQQQQAFNQYFGARYSNVLSTAGLGIPSSDGRLSVGQLAALALDPNIAEPLLQEQVTAAQIGGASVTAGVGALGVDTATQLSQAGITVAQATNAFQSLAPYATLEHPRPGMGGEAAQGVVSPTQLVTGALLGNTAAQRQLQTAEEVAKQPFAGGGGFVQNAKGAVGAGSSSEQGAGNT